MRDGLEAKGNAPAGNITPTETTRERANSVGWDDPPVQGNGRNGHGR